MQSEKGTEHLKTTARAIGKDTEQSERVTGQSEKVPSNRKKVLSNRKKVLSNQKKVCAEQSKTTASAIKKPQSNWKRLRANGNDCQNNRKKGTKQSETIANAAVGQLAKKMWATAE